jgi:glutamate--cysteine ligase
MVDHSRCPELGGLAVCRYGGRWPWIPKEELVPKEPMTHPNGEGIDTTPVGDKAQLVDYLATGCRPPEEFRLGTEQEMFVYQGKDYRPACYDGPDPGIRSLLEGMTRFGWELVYENGLPIALKGGNRTITLEPGGQLELSGAQLDSAHDTVEESYSYQRQIRTLSYELGLHFLALGHQPKWSRHELPWMPKQRYRIMRAHMPSRGSMGLDMMQSTCGIQVNMDFSSEADMVKKYRVSLALQPLATMLFSNSPFACGRISGYLSYRSHIWRHTDHDRCGSPAFVFEEGMGFERYTDYLLDQPMYFVIRDGRYIDAGSESFRDFLDGRLSALPGQRPILSDWVSHVSTVFPHVRLKRYLEVRGADAGDSTARVVAFTAFWAGLLYDTEALDSAWERLVTWTPEERLALEAGVAKHGLNTPFRSGTGRDLCLWGLELSRQGLVRRHRRNQQGLDESCYLAPLQEVAQSGTTFAEQLMLRFEDGWQQDIEIAVRSMCEEWLS